MKFTGKYGKILFAILIFCINATFYFASMAPGLTFIDSGELSSCAALYGIPHPTGYPLYSILTRVFIFLTSFVLPEPVSASNVFSVLCAAAAGVVLSLAIKKRTGFIPAFIFNAAFCFHPVMFSVATETEVYALSSLLSSVLIALYMNSSYQRRGPALYLLISYLCGLSLGNHFLIIGIALPVFVFSVSNLRKKSNFFALSALTAAAAGASIYLSTAIRSSCSPPLDWGGTSRGFGYLYNHVTGKQYMVWMFSGGITAFVKSFASLIRIVFLNGFLPIYIFSIPGAVFLFKNKRSLFFLILFVICANLAYSSSYSIPDIDPYVMPSILSVSVLSAFGLFWLFSKKKSALLTASVLILAVYPVYDGFRKSDKSSLYLPRDYAESILYFLPESSVYLANAPGALAWEEVSPLIYLQTVKKNRTDVLVVDKELLRRSWYVIWLDKKNTELSSHWKKEFSEFLNLLCSWEKGESVDVEKLQISFENLIFSIYTYGKTKGGFFVSNPPGGHFTAYPDPDLVKVRDRDFLPYGFFFTDDSFLDDSEGWKKIVIRPIPSNLTGHERVLMITENIKQSLWRKVFAISSQDEGKFTERARPYIEFILSIDKKDSLALDIIKRFY